MGGGFCGSWTLGAFLACGFVLNSPMNGGGGIPFFMLFISVRSLVLRARIGTDGDVGLHAGNP